MVTPKGPNDRLTNAQVGFDFGAKKLKEQSPSQGKGEYSIAIAKVIRVDYEAMEVVLMTQMGEDDIFQKSPIPLSFPGVGPRHFFGAMPERGSYAVIGYLPNFPHKTPVILSWIVPGVELGYDWVPTQEHEPTEFDFNFRRQTELEGLYEKARRKLRHLAPGNILASSAQGADLVLDESVLLVNRRANKIEIRDQDQAIITQSQVKFDVQGGVRVYSGMVQRDATLLPTQMFSDGQDWASFKQRVGNVPVTADNLIPDKRASEGELTPHDVYLRGADGNPVSKIDFGYNIEGEIDPYNFLARGLFIDSSGMIIDEDLTFGATYGGKRVFRTFYDPISDPDNRRNNSFPATSDDDVQTLTEHRIEVSHIWDQRLPVSEQTDGFDADRLPGSQLDETNDLLQGDKPYVTVVYGSVVGNDPYSSSGREVYGVPLSPVIFNAETGNAEPALVSGLDIPVEDHAATLFQVTPPLDPNVASTFFSVTKSGQVKGSVVGNPKEDSIEIAATGGVKVLAGGPILFESVGGVCFQSRGGNASGNLAYEIDSKTGGIKISGGGPISTGMIAAVKNPQDGDMQTLPHVKIEAMRESGNVHVEASKNILIASTNSIQLDRANDVTITPKNLAKMLTEKVAIQATTYDKTIMGQNIELYSGPKSMNPANLPLRSVKFAGNPTTGFVSGTADEYEVVYGDRVETFRLGDHTTSILIGNMTYKTGVGTVKHQAGLNTVELSTVAGYSASVKAGTMSMSSVTTATLSGKAAVSVKSNGPASLSGATATLGGNGKVGGIVCQSDIDPLSGLPLGALGLGSPGHFLGPNIP